MTQLGGPVPAPAPVGGGAFDVDIARAPQAIRELQQARVELQRIRQDALSLAEVRPPAADQVSLDAAQKLSETANGGPQSFMAALEAGIEEITRMMEALRSGFAAYEAADENSSLGFVQRP